MDADELYDKVIGQLDCWEHLYGTLPDSRSDIEHDHFELIRDIRNLRNELDAKRAEPQRRAYREAEEIMERAERGEFRISPASASNRSSGPPEKQ